MVREVLSNFPYGYMPTAVMLVFLLFFCSMVWWVFRKKSKQIYQKIERLPLEEGNSYGEQN